MKFVTVIGARPQFVKAAVVSKALQQQSIKEILIHTGQHFDSNMSDIFFEELEMNKPDYYLNVGGGTHGQNTGRMLEKIEAVLFTEKPDAVLVYGDTDSTLAGALAAAKLHIPVAHVEAGLRSFNRRMPEEINRILTDHVSNWLFTPTQNGVEQLINEGISTQKIFLTGDVMYDATLHYTQRASDKSDILKVLKLAGTNYYLATVHRADNVDIQESLQELLHAFSQIEQTIVWPIHPRTRKRIQEFNLKIPSQVLLIDPVGYLDMLWLEKNAKLILTDSGGVQKEAFFHSVPCVTLRNETEWTELVELGVNFLAGIESNKILESIEFAKKTKTELFQVNLYGLGKASHQIAQHLTSKTTWK